MGRMTGHIQIKSRANGGFSLLEMAMVLLAGSFIAIMVFTILIQTAKLAPTEDRMSGILYGISEYVRIHGHYPCPASMSAAPGDQYYSVEARSATAPYACNESVLNTAGPDVITGAVPVSSLAAAADCNQDPASLPGWDNLGSFPAWIEAIQRTSLRLLRQHTSPADSFGDENNKISAEPCLYDNYITDKYDGKFLYAVTRSATRLDTYNTQDGSANRINIYDRNNALVSTQTFVVVSMGEDGKGAIKSAGGAAQIACGSTDLDSENCNGDASFRDMYSALGTEYFDDYIDYSLAGFSQDDNMWHWGGTVPAPAQTQDTRDIYFNPKARMFLGPDAGVTPTPEDLLYVQQGDLHIESGSVGGGNLKLDNGQASAGNEVSATADVTAGSTVISPKFCYDSDCDGL